VISHSLFGQAILVNIFVTVMNILDSEIITYRKTNQFSNISVCSCLSKFYNFFIYRCITYTCI